MEHCSSVRSLPSFCLLLLLQALTQRGALGLRHSARAVEDSEEVPATNKSYILHKPCPSQEGIGSSLKFVKPIIEVALLNNLTYVCRVKDFRSKNHNTGYLGFLFGCYNDSYVEGDLAAYEALNNTPGMPKVDARIRLVDSPNSGASFFFPLNPHSTSLQKTWEVSYTPMSIKSGRVYMVDQPGLMMRSWGVSYQWFRSQYHLVRQNDPARREVLCGAKSAKQLDPKRKRVVVQIRKGDANLKTPTHLFVQLVDTLLAGEIPGLKLREEQAHIVVISESDEGMEDFNKYKKAKVTFLLGKPVRKEEAAQSRLVRDLDCMSTADFLVVSRGGFSSLAAALQMDSGISLAMSDPADVANARAVQLEDKERIRKREERHQKHQRDMAIHHEKKVADQIKHEQHKDSTEDAEHSDKGSVGLSRGDLLDTRGAGSRAGSANSGGSDARQLRLPPIISLDEHYDGLPSSFVINLAVQAPA
mmetsp:Transcript_87327/g.231982  ORF Transcript_87327/g.231982 Transcript_87327/m.231982 type:complete len:474 (-) Transcript_87327:105-1526(-)